MKEIKTQKNIMHYVTVRDERSGALLSAWPFYRLHDAEVKRSEQASALDAPGNRTLVEIETLDVETEKYPPRIKKNIRN